MKVPVFMLIVPLMVAVCTVSGEDSKEAKEQMEFCNSQVDDRCPKDSQTTDAEFRKCLVENLNDLDSYCRKIVDRNLQIERFKLAPLPANPAQTRSAGK